MKTNGTASDNEWQRVTTSGTMNDKEWQQVVQQVTASSTRSGKEWEQVTTYDNDWQRMIKSDKKCQWVRVNEDKWWNDWKRMRVSKIEWLYVLKWNKRPIWFMNNLIQFFMEYITTIRSSRSQVFFEIVILKNFARLTVKRLCWSLEACNFIRKRLQCRCFPVDIAKFLRKV